jgi:circadian clock protein KaiC
VGRGVKGGQHERQTSNESRWNNKCPSGIQGLDEITGGGLPRGRPTLVCGSAGSGKTLFALQFLVQGILECDEPGVFIAFEETAEELAQNVASLGFDLKALIARKKLAVDYVYVERSEIEETGEYDLEGLFVRLASAIDSVGAKRVALDTLESLFGGLSNTLVLRSEMRRLFRWLKGKGVTAVVTAERGDGTLTRFGLEEYVSDCVILLDHRVNEQVATRRMRIVKYRGSVHGTNEYPFLIDEKGFSVLPITSLVLKHTASTARISSGIRQIDQMLGGKGYFRGSSVLVSGTAGTGKTSVAAHFVDAACRRGERCLYFAFEESESQIVHNMRSIGIDLLPWIDKGLLRFHTARPTAYGLETHLAVMHKLVDNFQPRAIVVDPINNLSPAGTPTEVKTMLMRLVDYLKAAHVTTLFTSLTSGDGKLEETDVGISSLMDTWLLLRNMEASGERNRGLYVLKSRGMAHSNQIREFTLADDGVELRDVYLGPAGVLTGSARVAQEIEEREAALARQQETERKRSSLEHKRQALDAQIAMLRSEFEAQAQELGDVIMQDERQQERRTANYDAMAQSRGTDNHKPRKGGRK